MDTRETTKPRQTYRKTGTGDVRQRKDGRFEGRYYFDSKRYSCYASTRREVQNKLNDILVSIQNGSYIGKNRESLISYFVNWLKKQERYLRPATFTLYEGYIYKHILPHFKTMKIQKITTDDLQEFFDIKKIKGRADGKPGGISVKYRKNIKNMMNEVFSHAVERKILVQNPMLGVKLERMELQEQRVLNDEQVTNLIQKAERRHTAIANAVIFLLNTGVRKGEMLGLRWEDVNFSEGYVHIRNSLKRIRHPNKYQKEGHILVSSRDSLKCKTGIYLAPTKTVKSKRIIPLGEKGITSLISQKDRQDRIVKQNRLSRASYNRQGFVFCSDQGDYLEPRYFEEHFKRFLKEAGCQEINIHATRHTFATKAVASNPSEITTVSEILGHANVSTTLKYTHTFDEKKKKLMDLF